MKVLQQISGFVIVVGMLFTFGCASKVAPVETISSAEMAIKVAKESTATINAPLELRLAEDKLNAAKEAVKEEEFEEARYLAEQALLDAKFAETKSLSLKAKETAQEMRESIETLQREIERMQKREHK